MPGLLKSGDIAAMRRRLNSLLPDTATIERATKTKSAGEVTEAWSPIARGIACRIAPIGGGETGSIAGRISERTTHLVTVAAAQDVEEADRIAVNGSTYEVTLVRKRGAWELSRRVEVREL